MTNISASPLQRQPLLEDAVALADHERYARQRLDDPAWAYFSGGAADAVLEKKLNMSLAELSLSVRASNCLESENIATVRDLVVRTADQLLEVRNFGETTLTEVQEKLDNLGLHLGMRL